MEWRPEPILSAYCEAADGRYPPAMSARHVFLAALLACLPLAGVAQPVTDRDLPEDATVAFLGITLIDTSTEGDYFGAREDEAARIELIEQEVRDRFEAEGYSFVDTAPVAEELSRTRNPAHCNGCEVRMGETLGADLVLVGQVQKVSNLILAIDLALREVETGTFLRGQSVDIRSNTDESWRRGIDYILKYNVFAE